MMNYEWLLGNGTSVKAWRCFCCGDIIDRTILGHRQFRAQVRTEPPFRHRQRLGGLVTPVVHK